MTDSTQPAPIGEPERNKYQIVDDKQKSEVHYRQQRNIKLLDMLPKVLWFLLVVILLWIFVEPLKKLLPRLNGFEGYGLKIVFQSFEEHNRNMAQNVALSKAYIGERQQKIILNRSEHLLEDLKNMHVLWIDDHPSNNKYIIRIFQEWGVKFDCPSSTKEARRYLEDAKSDSMMYDLIISDFCHPNEIDGIKFADTVRTYYDYTVPIIFFSASYGSNIEKYGTPYNIFAATDRYDYLFHFIFDVLERGGTPYPASAQRFIYGVQIDSMLLRECNN